jgi:hypothetical protein
MHQVLVARFPNTPITVSISEPFQGTTGIHAEYRNGL